MRRYTVGIFWCGKVDSFVGVPPGPRVEYGQSYTIWAACRHCNAGVLRA